MCSAVEAELTELDPEERSEFLEELGFEGAGLNRVVHATYDLLGLITFYTEGENEARAWTVRRGTLAAEWTGPIRREGLRGAGRRRDPLSFQRVSHPRLFLVSEPVIPGDHVSTSRRSSLCDLGY